MTPAVLEQGLGVTEVETKLQTFCDAIEEDSELELDGVVYKDEEFLGKKVEEDVLKIDNHRLKSSYFVSLRAIMTQDIPVVVEALKTGIREKLYGITRIVGYYSRTSNWNLSKKGELVDRIRGRAVGGYYVSSEHKPSKLEDAENYVKQIGT